MVVRGLFRGRRRTDEDVQSLFVEGDESHAWWAERDNVTIAPSPKKRGAAARANETKPSAQSNESGFKRYFTNESLYTQSPEPDEPLTAEALALELLDVTGDPTWKAITKAYRDKAKEFHPDRCNGDDTEMVKINQAYALLRRVYG